MTVGDLHAEGAAARAPREGLPDPTREVRWLLAQALERSETWSLAHRDETVLQAFHRNDKRRQLLAEKYQPIGHAGYFRKFFYERPRQQRYL